MDQPAYSFRPSVVSPERRFALGETALELGDGRSIPFAGIRRIRFYEAPGFSVFGGEVTPATIRCLVSPAAGRRVVLSSHSAAGVANVEDRRAALAPFIEELMRRTSAANPRVELVAGMPGISWFGYLIVLLLALWAVLGSLAAMAGLLFGGGGTAEDWLGWLFLLVVGAAVVPVTLLILVQGRSRPFNVAALTAK